MPQKIKKMVTIGKGGFIKRKELLKGRQNRNMKKRMVKALKWSLYMLCGAEIWTMRKDIVKRIEMWIWRGSAVQRYKRREVEEKRYLEESRRAV